MRSGVRLLGYCLMTNHVHLVAVPEREDSLAQCLAGVHSKYAMEINRAEGRCGHLWQNRFYSCPLDERHLITALLYIDLNPVRAGLTAAAWDWPWSSASAHSMELAVDTVLDCHWATYCRFWNHREWQDLLLAGIPDGESCAVRTATRNGEPLGSVDFVIGLERKAGRRLRPLPRGRPRKMVSDTIY